MELQQLRYFVAVAETEHVARAAERLHISQSPLSRQIRQLEDHLGLQLFERIKQRVRLTPAGRDFLEQARDLLSRAERVEERARQIGKGEACSLSVGYCEGIIHNGRLPAALRHFRAAHPRVNLKLAAMRSGEQIEALERSLIDVAFVYNLPKPTESLTSRLLTSEPFVLALADDHALAAKEEIAPSDLDGMPWIALPKAINPAARERFLAACAASGFTPDIQFEVAHVSTTLGLVSARLGAAVMQSSMQRMSPPGVVFKRIDWLPLTVDIHLLWRAHAQTAGLRHFMRAIEETKDAGTLEAISA
jgi:DNA-binding transcriptional LysR family regulator